MTTPTGENALSSIGRPIEGFVMSGNRELVLWTCGTCFATVMPRFARDHFHWHEATRSGRRES